MKISLGILIVFLAAISGCNKIGGGQTATKEFYSDGTLKTITTLDSDGTLQSITYHTPNGIPEHVDYYDRHKRITKTIFYRKDGTPGLAKEFDDLGKALSVQPFDEAGKPNERHSLQ